MIIKSLLSILSCLLLICTFTLAYNDDDYIFSPEEIAKEIGIQYFR